MTRGGQEFVELCGGFAAEHDDLLNEARRRGSRILRGS